jgi:phosphatidylglycerol:prolipoprotein diacylglycerol transferase
MSLLAAIPYDLFTFGPFEVPLLSDFFQAAFNVPLKVHSFGMFVAIGLLTTFTLCARKGERKLGIDGEEVQNFGIYLIAIGWIFAHVFNVIFYEPQKVAEDPLILLKFWGSISSYGGLFGGIIAAWVWRWRNPDKDFLVWTDLAAWGLTFSWFFGRVGCASVHDHPGRTTDFFLAVSGWPDGTTRHDLGLYEAIWWALICGLVLWLDRKPRPKGFYLALVPTLYAPARFFLDFLRVGPELGGDIRYFGLTPAQYFSIGIFFVGLYFWNRVRKQEPMEWKEYQPDGETSADTDVDSDDGDSDDADEDDSNNDRKRSHRRKKRK